MQQTYDDDTSGYLKHPSITKNRSNYTLVLYITKQMRANIWPRFGLLCSPIKHFQHANGERQTDS